MSYEWATIFVVRHWAGSREGAVHQRNRWDDLIGRDNGEVVIATTKPADAAAEGLRAFLWAASDDE